MKIMITGYKGFIGQNMVNALKDKHELTVFEWGEPLPDLRGHDWCIHLGACSSTTETDVDKVLSQNYDFTRFLLNACQENGVNFQFASSASVYGLGKEFKETTPPSPQSPYAYSKYLVERYIEGFRSRWNITIQVFRYFNVYGPHEDHKGEQASPYHKFEKQAKETGVIRIFEGSENYLRDFVPVNRVIEVHELMMEKNISGLWNLGTGRPTSFSSVARMIADTYGANVISVRMPIDIKKHYQEYTCADLTKLRGILNEKNSS